MKNIKRTSRKLKDVEFWELEEHILIVLYRKYNGLKILYFQYDFHT